MDLISKNETVSEPKTASAKAIAAEINDHGFYNAKDLVPVSICDDVLIELQQLMQSEHAVKHGLETYALRNVLNAIPSVQNAAGAPRLVDTVHALLGTGARPVRAILFDKTDKVNWNLVWHQDLTIAVFERREAVGYGPWSVKNGIPHVQPPIGVLEKMVAARIHLDDCGIENGALRVIPQTHQFGRLEPDEIKKYRENEGHVICIANKGDVLFMRPLILHCSKKASKPEHRRVLHIEFAAVELPNGLKWGN